MRVRDLPSAFRNAIQAFTATRRVIMSAYKNSEAKTISSQAPAVSLSQRAGIAAIGGILGVFLLIGVGFANPNIIHDAAHDARHANAFPCH
ncbi:MAG: CbtB-domain containing protein [Rhodospirillaceae bacterium]|nr:CbtB-domain containing protein [Rhodospirillaceae bacterium]